MSPLLTFRVVCYGKASLDMHKSRGIRPVLSLMARHSVALCNRHN
jgi:hypothetical protein